MSLTLGVVTTDALFERDNSCPCTLGAQSQPEVVTRNVFPTSHLPGLWLPPLQGKVSWQTLATGSQRL